jgi:hypothetical protein
MRRIFGTIPVCATVLWRIALAAATPAAAQAPAGGAHAEAFARAARNGDAANEALVRSQRLVNAWLEHADPATGLLPRNLGESRDLWNAHDSAADLYPFLVLTASFTDPALYQGRMHDILLTETALTSRVGRMPDAYSFSRQAFVDSLPRLERVIFGASEYVKDGLMPITEWLGPSPWRARMLGIVDDIWRHAPVQTPHGRIPSIDPEVNGEMLQVLARVYWMTGEPRYLDYAQRLGDYYLLGGNHPTRHSERLRLRDHGNEIVSGLTELYATLRHARPERADAYREPIHAMLDRILEVGRNPHGLFFNVIDPRSGEAVDPRTADNWGYILNGFYTVYLVDRVERYRDATRAALAVIDRHYREYDWESGSADGDADAIEGALNLYNREPVEEAARWIDSQTRFMWSKQDSAHRAGSERWRGSGIVEGWHGDGNFARTSLMYALWKTQGTSLHPWRRDLIHGAERSDGALLLSVRAAEGWEGELRFDVPRHRVQMGMPLDWPRINQFPEWFTVQPDALYEVVDAAGGERSVRTGAQLRRGLPLRLPAGGEARLVVRLLGGRIDNTQP